ncbi:MAG: S-layer homology domain-containing protein, partial [Candidatus Peregrinibacteria bacterium]
MAQSFSDVPADNLYAEDIEFVSTKGIVNGYKDGTFRPDATINRAEFTKIIIGSLFSFEDISSCDIGKYTFSDIEKTEWFAPYVCKAKKEGIIHGYSDGTFKPQEIINLSSSVKIIITSYKISYFNSYSSPQKEYYFSYFTDRLFNDKKFSFKYPLRNIRNKNNSYYSKELRSHFFSRGEIAYFIKKMEEIKTILNDENFYIYKNKKAGFSIKVPKISDGGETVIVEEYDDEKKESLVFITSEEEWKTRYQENYENLSKTGTNLWKKSIPGGFFTKTIQNLSFNSKCNRGNNRERT